MSWRNAGMLVLLVLAAACTGKEGPAEQAGERIDDAVSDARDRIERVGDEAQEAADEIRDAFENE